MCVRMQGHWEAYSLWSASASRSQPLSVSIHLIYFSIAPPTLWQLPEASVSVEARITRKSKERSRNQGTQREA